MNKTIHKIILNTAAAALLSSAILHAQDSKVFELEPLVVRGDLLNSSIEEMSASVSIIRPVEATSAGSPHFENLLGRLPNLNWAGGTSRPRFFQIRGIGENSQFGNEIPSSSVGFIVDGIDLTGIGGIAGLFDVAQVEVLRGPQAAAFGANALAGMIVIETTAPSVTSRGKTELTFGENDLFSFGLAVGGPVGDKDSSLSYRVSVHQYQDNGFRKNTFLGSNDTNERNERTARLKLNWAPSAKFEFDLTALYFDFDNGYDVWALTNNSFITTTDEPGEDDQETSAVGIRATWHVAEEIDLSYLASVSSSDLLYSYDWDWSNPDELEELYGPEIYWGIDLTERERIVSSHDLRLASPVGTPGAGQSITWTAGAYYRNFEEEQLYWGVKSRYTTENRALYGQSRLTLNKSLSLTLAGRLEEVDIDFSDGYGTSLGSKARPWGGKAAAEYTFSENSALYASVDRGFKAGGVNLDDDVPEEFRVYGTEYLWNYEIGWRAFLLEKRLRIQLTAFHMDRDDIQVDSSIQLGDGNTFALFKDNAASGHNSGLETEIDWQISTNLRIFASLGLLDTEFDNYRYINPDDGLSEIVLDGREQAYAPGYTYAFGGEFTTETGFFMGATLEGKDSYVFDVENKQSLSAYNLFHLHLGYKTGNWRFTVWANNLFDERYETRGFYFANEPPYYDTPKKWVSQGTPRLIGVSAQWAF